MESPLDVLSRAASLVETKTDPTKNGISTTIVENGETQGTKNSFKGLAPSKIARARRSCERRELCTALGLGLCNHVTSPYSPHSNPTRTKCAGTQTMLTSLSNGGSFMTSVSETESGRPSVITCMPSPVRDPKPTLLPLPLKIAVPAPILENMSDLSVEAHFRRSLGSAYKEEYFQGQEQEAPKSVAAVATSPMSPSVSVSGSVDDHFAKALGDKWSKIQSTNGTGKGHNLLKQTSMVSI